MAEKKSKAVFLDRDGVIIEQVELPRRESDLKLIPGIVAAIRMLNELGYLVIIVSNQPVVARGIITLEEAHRLNHVLMERLMKEDARIDAEYLCPHHPQANLEEYRKVCDCRKPAPGMILHGAAEHNVDLSKSFMIGDSTQDVQAGIRVGVKTILVQTGHGGNDPWQHEGTPDFVVKDLAEAAEMIKKLS